MLAGRTAATVCEVNTVWQDRNVHIVVNAAADVVVVAVAVVISGGGCFCATQAVNHDLRMI